MTNIYFLLQCQYINKRKGYENISKGSLQEKLALIFNQILSTSSSCLEISLENFPVVIGRTKNKIANVELMYERPRVNVNLIELQLLRCRWTSTFA